MADLPNVIDDRFIETWEPKYDETEHDEGEYGRLIEVFRCRVHGKGLMTKETFVDVLRWKKAARVMTYKRPC